jgi:hypothetical protein
MKRSLKPLQFIAAHCILAITLMTPVLSDAQCKPSIKIDGAITVADDSDQFGIDLPFWLKEGQTLSVGSSVSSISVIEFTENGTSLEYSDVLNITSTSPVSVPTGKVWKVEAIIKVNNSSSYKSATFSAGTFSWKVPACAEQICVEAWGGGGGGSGSSYSGGWTSGAGGGGGGFGSQCFTVVPGTTYSITVGSGGNGGNAVNPTGQSGGTGGTTTFGSLLTATGGNGGTGGSSGGTGGAGGNSTATSSAQGANGGNGGGPSVPGGAGGAGGNGGSGGAQATGGAGVAGSAPGGGGSGAGYGGNSGGKGAEGRLIVTW